MAADLHITRDAELMVAAVQGVTEAGIEFVDSWVRLPIVVADAGLIVIHEQDLDALRRHATGLELTYEQEEKR